jgi:hypothetical protein
VFTAKHDSFTAPFEGRDLASRCRDAAFVMLDRGDHLAPIEHPRTVIALYDAFVNTRSLDVPGVITGAAANEACAERRMLPRRDGRGREVRMSTPQGGQVAAGLLDYNALGCLLDVRDEHLIAADEPVRVSIPAIGAEGDAVLLPDARGARAVFLHDAFGSLGRMPVMTVEMPVPRVESGPRRVSIAERLAAITDE